jgi:hypothetical protein
MSMLGNQQDLFHRHRVDNNCATKWSWELHGYSIKSIMLHSIMLKTSFLKSVLFRLEWTSNHQCTSLGWGRSSHFGDEPKTHPLPFPWFSQPSSLPQTFPFLPNPPSYFPPTYLPLPTFLTSFCIHSITGVQDNLKTSKLWRVWCLRTECNRV